MRPPTTPQSAGRVRQRVARSRHVATDARQLDEKLIERCVESWVAAYEHAGKWKERGRAGKAQFDGVSVDELLADAGIHFPTGVHRMSPYRQYEHEIVKRAYERMGIVRPADVKEYAGPATVKNCARLYLLGLTMDEVAEAVGKPRATVCEWLRKAGVKSRRRGRMSRKNRRAA